MENKSFSTDNIFEVIDSWTEDTVRSKMQAEEQRLNKQLIPELRKELAVKELQECLLARISDDHAVRNLAAKFVLSLKGGLFEDAYNCFALETEGTQAKIEKYGIYEGKESLHAYFVDYYGKIGGSEGCFIEHELTTPVVEVAEDGKTAEAMFIAEGVLAVAPEGWLEEHGVSRSLWQIGPWYLQFVKENGEWKIWKLTVYDEIETPYEQSWSEFGDHASVVNADAPKPDKICEDINYFTASRKPFLHQEPPCTCDAN